jgi:hypothetical protein
MTLSMYQASVPVFVRNLSHLAAILDKAAAHAAARKIDPAVLVGARLYPDMLPLVRQVQIATDHAKNGSGRLAGAERPVFEDEETTFEQLQARIAKTLDYLKTLEPARFEGSDEREVSVPVRGRELVLKGAPYLVGFAQPNFYFHVCMAYAILRHNGVEIGKTDFIGALPD